MYIWYKKNLGACRIIVFLIWLYTSTPKIIMRLSKRLAIILVCILLVYFRVSFCLSRFCIILSIFLPFCNIYRYLFFLYFIFTLVRCIGWAFFPVFCFFFYIVRCFFTSNTHFNFYVAFVIA